MGINERLEKIEQLLEKKDKKPKKFNFPWKAKIGNKKVNEGYVTIIEIKPNKNVIFKKEKIIDGTIKLDDTIHSLNSDDIFLYKRQPLVFQFENRLNPYNPLKEENETYGQKYLMARMEGDKLTHKRKIGLGISIGLIIIAGIVIYSLIAG